MAPGSDIPTAMSEFELISSAMPSASDIPSAMSAFRPIASVLPPAPDVGGTPGECLKLVESGCGAVAVGSAYLCPPLSPGGASIAGPLLRFHTPLIEPDVRY